MSKLCFTGNDPLKYQSSTSLLCLSSLDFNLWHINTLLKDFFPYPRKSHDCWVYGINSNDCILNAMSVPYGLPSWHSGKEPACQCRRCRFNPWVRKPPWRRKRQPTPVFLPGESHGRGSLTPTFQSTPPQVLGNHKSVLYVCESVSLSYISSSVSYFRLHI